MRAAAIIVMLGAWQSAAQAQDYRMPASTAQWDLFYPTAYKDHSGVDWNCGDLRYGGHNGSDFGAGGFTGMDEGRDILAAAAGEVVYVHDGEFDRCTGECSNGFGNYVRLEHADGKNTIYGHLKQWSIAVAEGDTVACGDLLGQMGSSGNSTGPHLHFEVRAADNVAHDPFLGDCSSPPSYWVAQWRYGELPMPYCDRPLPPCQPVALLSCGSSVADRNDGAGSTSTHLAYGCTEFAYTGSERSWRFATDLDESVTIRLTGLIADLDLFALASDSCAGDDCVAASGNSDAADEELIFAADANREYLILVDGFELAASDFDLAIECAGSLPGADAGIPADASTALDAGDAGGAGHSDSFAGGCGCQSGNGRSPHPVLGLFAALYFLAGRARRWRVAP
jgi:MYXO-CTERM domain-containing protein